MLTLIQTGKSAPMPIVFIDQPGGTYWKHWQHYVEKELLGRGLIGEEDLRLYRITDDIDQAVAEVTHFYSNFHSVRYMRDDIILRLHRRPTEGQLKEIAKSFSDIKVKGDFRLSGPLAVEKDEPALANLHRLIFAFNRRDHGRFRMLIDALNDLPVTG